MSGKQTGNHKRTTVKNMTSGSPLKLILAFLVPLLLGNLFQQAYNIADGVIVGRILGANALAAIGATTSVQTLTLNLCMGCCAGFSIPIAQRFGAGDLKAMRNYVFHAILLSSILAVILTLLMTSLCDLIITIMQVPAEIRYDTYLYILVIFLGIPFAVLYNMTAGLLRAVGNSRAPFYFLAVSTTSNIFLDIFCIAVLRWGCVGAAIATIASEALSGTCCLIYILKKVPTLWISKDDCRVDPHVTGIMVATGVPMGLQYTVTSIGLMVMQSANNSLGGVCVSGFAAGAKLKALIICPFDAMATSLATFVSQNYGAQQMNRVRSGIRWALILSVGYGIVAGIIMVRCGFLLSSMFLTEDNREALAASAAYLRCMGYCFWVLGFLNVYRSFMQALGASGRSVLSGAIEMTFRSIVALVFVPLYGYTAICWTDQAAWFTATIYLMLMGTHVLHVRIRQAEAEPAAAAQ